jgi:hypothetical protein
VTLILLMANDDHVVQISDRRFTGDAPYCTDEGAKIGTLLCGDARLAFAFTGLAVTSGYVTLDWLMEKILDCAAPDYGIDGIISRLTPLLDQEFASNPSILSLAPTRRRLSIVFSGYRYTSPTSPHLMAIFISNYTELRPGLDGSSLIQIDSPTARVNFRVQYFNPTDPTKPSAFVARLGAVRATVDEDMAPLAALLTARKPERAVIGRAIKTIRRIADRRSAQGLIGKQLNSIVVPPQLDQLVRAQYHSAVNTNRMYWPAMIDARLGMRSWIDMSITDTDANDPRTWIVPQIRRDYPCPCKSGKRYKACHGRRTTQTLELRHAPIP